MGIVIKVSLFRYGDDNDDDDNNNNNNNTHYLY